MGKGAAPEAFRRIAPCPSGQAQYGHAEPVIGPGPGGRLQPDSVALPTLPIGFLESSYRETFSPAGRKTICTGMPPS